LKNTLPPVIVEPVEYDTPADYRPRSYSRPSSRSGYELPQQQQQGRPYPTSSRPATSVYDGYESAPEKSGSRSGFHSGYQSVVRYSFH
jgi:hypothetical protein